MPLTSKRRLSTSASGGSARKRTHGASGAYSASHAIYQHDAFRHHNGSSPGCRYEILENEVVEDEHLEVFGETIIDDNDIEDTVPVRILTEFSIYDAVTLQLVNIGELRHLDPESDTTPAYGASGLVKPYRDGDADETEEDDDISDSDHAMMYEPEFEEAKQVKLSEIVEFNIHYVSNDSDTVQIDPKIYIRTKLAWYILDQPSENYYPFFVEFWIRHRMFHLVVLSSILDHSIDHDRFVESLAVSPDSPDTVAVALKIIRRELTEKDLHADDVQAYIHEMLNELCHDHIQLRRALSRVPLIRSLRCSDTCSIEPDDQPLKQWNRKAAPTKRLRDIEKDILLHRNKTVVTPAVAGVARRLFKQTLRVAGNSLQDAGFGDKDITESDPIEPEYVHYTDPTKVDWVVESRLAPHHYGSVMVDGAQYSIGDIVVVEKGSDGNSVREKNAAAAPSRSSNWLANTKWFCQISYMFERKEELVSKYGRRIVHRKYFHARWLQHGSQMLLQETAHPNELFFLCECDDLPIECIFRLCNLRILDADEPEPAEESNDGFFARLTWEQRSAAFVEVTSRDIQTALDACRPWKRCYSCGVRALREKEATWRLLSDGGISGHGEDYHVDDFVYILPGQTSQNDALYDIGQITDLVFDKHRQIKEIEIRRYGRYDRAVRDCGCAHDSSLFRDDRRLFRTHEKVIILPGDIEGKLHVAFLDSLRERDDWLRHDHHFYVDLKAKSISVQTLEDLKILSTPISECQICKQHRSVKLAELEHFMHRKGPLRGLELFAGAGGLSTGMELSGFVQTKWAVEFSPSAALTYQKNHPHTVVYNQDSNLLLKHALDTHEGKDPKPLRSLHVKAAQELPAMPRQGEVDFVYGGPPCQSFSGMNHYKKADDIRNTLVCNMISYVEFYRPLYFLLENVTGLLFYPLNGQQEGRAIVGGIKMGVVKFILRALICLGYQAHFKVLQAGQYGAPQGRRRVIFWGAKCGVPLPKFPAPLHCFSGRGTVTFRLPTGDVLYPVTNSNVNDESARGDYHRYACLPQVTVHDAIGDLPPFDWCIPFNELPATEEDYDMIESRLASGISRFDAVIADVAAFPGFTSPTLYRHQPLTRYQLWVRQNTQKVKHHYTRRFRVGIVERVVNVPMKPDADHADLPRQLRVRRAFEADFKTPKKTYRGVYGRIDGDGFFATALTTVEPNAKGGRLLHPDQKRILTVRECARAQGFPDMYEFHSVNTKLSDRVADQHRQIGNAVPVPLALALGKELGKALLVFWLDLDRRDRERLLSPVN